MTCEIYFIHLEQPTIINKSNNLESTNENTEDEQNTKRIIMRCEYEIHIYIYINTYPFWNILAIEEPIISNDFLIETDDNQQQR